MSRQFTAIATLACLLLYPLPSCAADALSVHRVVSSDGTELALVEGGSGDSTIVFVHGWTCDRSYWDAQLSEFVQDHRVIAVDLAGHGESALGRESYSMANFGADVAAAAAGDGPVILVGHSMGGPVILAAAQLLGDRVLGLVGVDTLRDVAPPMSDEDIEARMAPFEQGYDALVRPAIESMFVSASDPDLRQRIITDMLATDHFVGRDAVRAMMRMDVAQALRELDAPLVLINSTYKPTAFSVIEELHPHSRLQLMDGVGHFVMMEDPATFNQLLREAIATFRRP